VPSVDKKEPLENDTRVLGRLQFVNSVMYWVGLVSFYDFPPAKSPRRGTFSLSLRERPGVRGKLSSKF
jgi:hypothetical protein